MKLCEATLLHILMLEFIFFPLCCLKSFLFRINSYDWWISSIINLSTGGSDYIKCLQLLLCYRIHLIYLELSLVTKDFIHYANEFTKTLTGLLSTKCRFSCHLGNFSSHSQVHRLKSLNSCCQTTSFFCIIRLKICLIDQ